VEKIVRTRVYDSRYWKEECFALTAELIVDKGMELRFVGGVYGGNIKGTPFLCLLLKMLQIQPDKDIVVEFIRQEDFKYVRALGAVYLRLTGHPVEVYKYLEPLFNDYRKLRRMNSQGQFELFHMDELIDALLRDERVCDIQMPRIQKRSILVETGELTARVSALDEDLDKMSTSSDEEREVREKEKRKAEKEKERIPFQPTHHIPAKKTNEGQSSSSSKGKDKDRSDRKDKDDKDRKRTRESSAEREIRESNELRAKLGLAPLQ